ncbi:MAG: hypothetical protein KAT71_08095 [Gammaproteobacteria bacterium]|nr:hypothetical protein [Gammaproteobacteria bacterium]
MSIKRKQIEDFNTVSATPSTDLASTGDTTVGHNAGETVAIMQSVYLKSDGEWWLTDANAVATADGMLAIALEAGTDTNPLKVALPNSFIRDDSWAWTVGGRIYLSGTAGALTQTAPNATNDVVRIVGHATHADRMYFNPEQTIVIHA